MTLHRAAVTGCDRLFFLLHVDDSTTSVQYLDVMTSVIVVVFIGLLSAETLMTNHVKAEYLGDMVDAATTAPSPPSVRKIYRFRFSLITRT